MKKVLFVATISQHILHFHLPFIKWFVDHGYAVDVACNGNVEIPYVNKLHNVCFCRSPYKLRNISAYRELKKIINQNSYELIHCHTPMGGVIGRLASRSARKRGTKVLYTAHGFHFFSGSPQKNWLLYYPIEKFLSRYTDFIITINKEDYQLAVEKFVSAKNILYVRGVGIDLQKFKPQTDENKKEFRNKYGYNETDFIIISVGELSYNKHQDVLIRAISIVKNQIPEIKLLLVGDGGKRKAYEQLISESGLDDFVELLGYRSDVQELMAISDIAISSSRREGLPLNVMEAMASGVPLIVSNCRGNRDLVCDEVNGFIVTSNTEKAFAEKIISLYNDRSLRIKFSASSQEQVATYSINEVNLQMQEIYQNVLRDRFEE